MPPTSKFFEICSSLIATSLRFDRQCGHRNLRAGATMATRQRLQPPGESHGRLIAMPGNVSKSLKKTANPISLKNTEGQNVVWNLSDLEIGYRNNELQAYVAERGDSNP
jgi:hypothetical protein